MNRQLARDLWEDGHSLVKVSHITAVPMHTLRIIRDEEGWQRKPKLSEPMQAEKLRQAERERAAAQRAIQHQQIVDLYAEGSMTVEAIAGAVGCSTTHVNRIAKEAGLRRPGAGHRPPLISPELRRRMADLYAKHNVSVAGLHLRFGFDKQLIVKALKAEGVYDGLRIVRRAFHSGSFHNKGSTKSALQRVASRS